MIDLETALAALNQKAAQNGKTQILVHAHRIYVPAAAYQPLRPERIAVTAIAVDNTDAATGYAYLDLTLGVTPTLGTRFSMQPGEYYRMYSRQTEAIATTNKLLMGLREEHGSTPYTVDAACADVLVTPGTDGHTWLSVLPCAGVPVLAEDPGV